MRPMTRADDLIPFQDVFGERCTIVGADVRYAHAGRCARRLPAQPDESRPPFAAGHVTPAIESRLFLLFLLAYDHRRKANFLLISSP